MAYFQKGFVDFFKGLAANNHRDWFNDNRKLYEKEVKKPFYHFLGDLITEISKSEPRVKDLQIKNAVFRINRDIRFSKDKTPYNLYVSAVVSPEGRKNMQYPGLYLHFNIDESHLGGGAYMPDKDNLQKIREYIIAHPQKVKNALKEKRFKHTYGDLVDGEKNKILPKELKEHGEAHPLIFNKQYYYMAKHQGEEVVLQPKLMEFVMEHYHAGQAWSTVLKDAMGLK